MHQEFENKECFATMSSEVLREIITEAKTSVFVVVRRLHIIITLMPTALSLQHIGVLTNY